MGNIIFVQINELMICNKYGFYNNERIAEINKRWCHFICHVKLIEVNDQLHNIFFYIRPYKSYNNKRQPNKTSHFKQNYYNKMRNRCLSKLVPKYHKQNSYNN